MLKATHLTKNYEGGAAALEDLNLTVARGEVFCLLGANGAGKTTTIHLFLGFLRPTCGSAWVGGIHVDEDPMGARQKTAYIPEQINLYPELSGLENLGYFTELSGRGNCRPAELRELLLQAGLPEESIRRPVATYSKGMRQKVGIAIALAKRAEVLLLDEPTSCLDPEAADEFSGLIRKFSEGGGTVLMATHDLARAATVATHLGIMRQGRLLTAVSAGIGPSDLEQMYKECIRS